MLKGVTQGSPGMALLREALVKGGLQGTASWGEALGHLRLGDTGGLGTYKAWGHAGREQGSGGWLPSSHRDHKGLGDLAPITPRCDGG